MDTKQYWDELADMYQDVEATTDWLLGYPYVIELLGDLNGKTILDYGCGSGKFTRFLAEANPLARVIGIDTSKTAIENAKRRTSKSLGVEYHHVADHNDIKNFKFDLAVSNFVFCTIPNIETLISLCKLIYAGLPADGTFVLLDPHPASHGKKFTSFQSDSLRNQVSGDRIHVRLFTDSIDVEFEDYFWTKDDYSKAVTAGGFTIKQILEPTAAEFADDRLGAEKDYPPFIIYDCKK